MHFEETLKYIDNLLKSFELSLKGIHNGNLKHLSKAKSTIKSANKQLPILHNNILKLSRYDKDESLEKSALYGKVLSCLNSITDHTTYICTQNLNYFDNNHTKFSDVQLQELNSLFKSLIQLISNFKAELTNRTFTDGEEFKSQLNEIKNNVKKYYDNQLKRFRKSGKNLRRNRLFFDNISDIDAIADNIEIVKKLTEHLFSEKLELLTDSPAKRVQLIEGDGIVEKKEEKSKKDKKSK